MPSSSAAVAGTLERLKVSRAFRALRIARAYVSHEISPASSNGFFGAAQIFKIEADTINLEPGSSMEFECFAATAWVVSGTIKAINILNTDGSAITYTISIIGRR